MGSAEMEKHCVLDEDSKNILNLAMTRLKLSARAYHRIVKVARTIADLEGVERITATHISEAIQYRSLDKENWGITA
jgi:magnesium chelatase family protein